MNEVMTGLNDWIKRGEALAVRVEETSKRMNADAWEVGDWWKDGGRFGDRAEIEAQRIFGRAYETIQQYGQIAKKFPELRRRSSISWTHHKEVAALPPKQADKLLSKAADEKWSTRALREEVEKVRNAPQIEHGTSSPGWSEDEKARKQIVLGGGTVVANMHRDTDVNLRNWASSERLLVVIDRNTDWGNPFILDKDGTRDEVIDNYEMHYLPFKPSLLKRLPELKGKVLGCWCHPDACHGHVLARKVDS